MTLLVDHQIAARQASGKPLATETPADDYKDKDSKIQAASLDLTIGEIYIPGTDKGKPGSACNPRRETTLDQGHTAVIRTKEILRLDSCLAGIAFPPSHVSLRGLLMTNPGHIDPGYHGPLHLTVINMSHLPFVLRPGDKIMSVLFIRLEGKPEFPFDVRRPDPIPNPITEELLGRLSVDFVDVKKRAKKIATRAVISAGLLATFIPIGVAGLALIGQLWIAKPAAESDVRKIAERVSVIETKFGQQALDGRVKKLEDAVVKLKPETPTKQ